MCSRVSEESYALNFDYFSFHKRCTRVLQAVCDEFRKEVKQVVESMGADDLDAEAGELPIVPYVVFELLLNEERRGEAIERLSKAMAGMVKEGGGREVLALREFLGSGRV